MNEFQRDSSGEENISDSEHKNLLFSSSQFKFSMIHFITDHKLFTIVNFSLILLFFIMMVYFGVNYTKINSKYHNEITLYKQMVSNLGTQNSGLSNLLEKSNTENQRLKIDIQNQNDRIDDLEKYLEDQNATMESMVTQISSLKVANLILTTGINYARRYGDFRAVTTISATPYENIGANGIKGLSLLSFPNLKTLNLNRAKIGDEGMKYLANMKLPVLENLYLNHNLLTETAMSWFVSMNLPNLKILQLSNNNISSKGVALLASNNNLSNLKQFGLGENNINAEGMTALSKSNLSSVTKLELYSNDLGDQGIKSLSQMTLPNLNQLYIYNTNFTEFGIQQLSGMDLSSLRYLDLSNNKINRIKTPLQLPKIAFLYLQNCNLGSNSGGLQNLSSNLNNSAISELILSGNGIGDHLVEFVAKLNLPNITWLDFSSNNISDAGLRAFSAMKLETLTYLTFQNNTIGNAGAAALSHQNLPNLKTLDLNTNNISHITNLTAKNLPKIGFMDFRWNNLDDQSKKALNQQFKGKVYF